MSLVAASERDRAQTAMRAWRGSDCKSDVVRYNDPQSLTERSWKDRPETVKAR